MVQQKMTTTSDRVNAARAEIRGRSWGGAAHERHPDVIEKAAPPPVPRTMTYSQYEAAQLKKGGRAPVTGPPPPALPPSPSLSLSLSPTHTTPLTGQEPIRFKRDQDAAIEAKYRVDPVIKLGRSARSTP